jgi:hypothetical protein
MGQDPAQRPARRFASFAEFYPHYLEEHRDPVNRRLHVAGTALVLALAVLAAVARYWALLAALPVAGYGLAWLGHFAFERNRPATFRHPWWSLRGDFAMFADVLRGRIRL